MMQLVVSFATLPVPVPVAMDSAHPTGKTTKASGGESGEGQFIWNIEQWKSPIKEGLSIRHTSSTGGVLDALPSCCRRKAQ